MDGKIDEVAELECASIVSEEEKEPEIEGYNAKPKTPIPDTDVKIKTGRRPRYDKDLMRQAFKDGESTEQIAKKFRLTTATVYQIKSKMKKAGELDDEEETPDLPVDNHPNARVKRMVADGETDQAIYNVMHNFMTDEQFRKAIEEARS